MAEMAEGSEVKKGGGKPRAKKHSTRIDMTPMVDLGFLLVTFFIFTTTLSKPTVMELAMPAEPETPIDRPDVNEKEVLVILLGDKNQIFYYEPVKQGLPQFKRTNFTEKGIRKVILEKKEYVASLGTEVNKEGKTVPKKATVLIKPTDKSTFQNFVDILDEISITEITKYVVVPPDPKELEGLGY